MNSIELKNKFIVDSDFDIFTKKKNRGTYPEVLKSHKNCPCSITIKYTCIICDELSKVTHQPYKYNYNDYDLLLKTKFSLYSQRFSFPLFTGFTTVQKYTVVDTPDSNKQWRHTCIALTIYRTTNVLRTETSVARYNFCYIS